MVSSSDNDLGYIRDNINEVRENIAGALNSAGLPEGSVRLMAVTKTVDPVRINYALAQGIDLIGENKVQEFLGKKDLLHLDGVEKHLIGHLQENKVKKILGQVDMIESVDSVAIAKALADRAVSENITAEVLLEVNIGEEEAKTGFLPERFGEELAEIAEFKGIHVRGLMSVPPICETEGEIRGYFNKMHKLFVDIGSKKRDNVSMEILSLGMSGDYVYAVAEGSNLVRVGSKIFGQRRY